MLACSGRFAATIRDWLRGDLVAGLTVWAVLVPESLAYASIAADVGQVRDVLRRADEGDEPETARTLRDAVEMVTAR